MGIEKNLIRASWSPHGDKVAAGSGDRTVAIWDVESKKMLYKLPGHRGSVNDVRFSPTEPISMSPLRYLPPKARWLLISTV